MKSKTIIISSPKNSNRGILTLFEENDLLKCKMRLYGVQKLNRNTKIGIYHNNEVSTANLIEREGVYYSSFVGDFDINGDFYTAIINTDNNNEVLLSGGTYAGYYFNDASLFCEKETEPDQDDTIPEQDCELDKCANCKYKEYFYNETAQIATEQPQTEPEQAQTQTSQADEEPSNEHAIPSILEQIIPQFNYIFENYPLNAELNALIENGKFVSMSDGDYSLGAIYENENLKYICYAVKSKYNSPPPEELGKFHQWLPLDKEDPLSDGYYIVFQDATDLKIIEV